MPLGQADLNVVNGSRPILDPGLIDRIRRTVAPLPFMWYDSMNIGVGQNALSRGWYDTWAGFGNAQNLMFFKGRDSNVDTAYANITEETADFAVEIHAFSVEFFAPTGDASRDTNPDDTLFVPDLFTKQLPSQSAIRISVQNGSDELLTVPCNYAPSGAGTSQPQIVSAAGPVVVSGTNGLPQFGNKFIMNKPFMLPAKASIQAELFLANPVRDILQNIAPPGMTQYTAADGDVIDSPKVYTIRIGLLGKRYLQLRGGRSA